MDTTFVESEDPAALNEFGLALAAEGRFDEAIEQYREAEALWAKANSSDRKLALTNWGDALRSKKLYEQAVRKYRQATEVDPEFAEAHIRLGVALATQAQYDEAIEQYRQADAWWAKTNSTDRKYALTNWGEVLWRKKLYDEAAQKCREAIQVDPDHAAAHYRLGLALAADGHYDEAIEHYRQAVALWEKTTSTDCKFALADWGDALQGKKLYAEAAQKYREAIQVDPEYAYAHNRLGLALAARGGVDEAIEHHRQADALWARDSSTDRKLALDNWGDALRGQKLYAEAAQKYREALRVDPEYATAYNGLGITFAA